MMLRPSIFARAGGAVFSEKDDEKALPGASVDARVLHIQAESLLQSSLSQPISGFLAALCFWVSFYYQMRHPGILVWAAIMHATHLQRFVQAWKYLKTPAAKRNTEHSIRSLCIALAVNGTAWGLAPWLFFPAGNMPLTSMMILLLLCLCSAAMVALSPYRQAVINFSTPIILGLATALFWQGDWRHSVLALGICLYGAVNLQFGLYLNRLLSDALRARLEKDDLAQRLAEEVKTVERASLEKTRFFAAASHDLRQPLHSLGLFGSAIHARLRNTVDEPLARNLMLCVDALETSFSSMLDVSKLDAGVINVKARPLAVADIFRRLQGTYAGQAEAQGLLLRFKPAGKWVNTDGALMERLLGNLIHNALKFTPQGGVVVLARSSGNNISLEVWDTGCGIDPAESSRIFDEFYQVGNQERDRAKGLGMGLAIVKRLAALLETPLTTASRPAKGSVFKVRVPGAPAQATPLVFNTQAINSGVFKALTGLRVLVIDDEASVRDSTSAALRFYGLNVDVADGWEQAREICQHLGPRLDAVISDYRLCNGKDGIDVVNDLIRMAGRPIPALLITGDTAPERVREAEKSGLTVLYKPVRIHQMVEALRVQISSAI